MFPEGTVDWLTLIYTLHNLHKYEKYNILLTTPLPRRVQQEEPGRGFSNIIVRHTDQRIIDVHEFDFLFLRRAEANPRHFASPGITRPFYAEIIRFLRPFYSQELILGLRGEADQNTADNNPACMIRIPARIIWSEGSADVNLSELIIWYDDDAPPPIFE